MASLVVIPAAFGVLGAFSSDWDKAIGPLPVFGMWAVLIFLLGVFAVWLNPAGEALLSLAVENEALEAKLAASEEGREQRDGAIKLLTFQGGYAISARATVLLHARRPVTTMAHFEAALKDLVVPLSFEGEYLFDLGPSEAWSFAVYLYSARRDVLVPVWRKKAEAHPSPQTSRGREWGRGEGHVGKAFVDCKPIITGNAFDPEAAQFSTLPQGRELPHDRVYVSFASVPIGPILAEDGRPYGVLVGTSDRPGRFNRDNAGIMIQIASATASLLIAGGLDIDNFLVGMVPQGGQAEEVR